MHETSPEPLGYKNLGDANFQVCVYFSNYTLPCAFYLLTIGSVPAVSDRKDIELNKEEETYLSILGKQQVDFPPLYITSLAAPALHSPDPVSYIFLQDRRD